VSAGIAQGVGNKPIGSGGVPDPGPGDAVTRRSTPSSLGSLGSGWRDSSPTIANKATREKPGGVTTVSQREAPFRVVEGRCQPWRRAGLGLLDTKSTLP
jgi:hypothetical protein